MRAALERGIVYASGMLKERERRLNRLPQGSGSRGPMDGFTPCLVCVSSPQCRTQPNIAVHLNAGRYSAFQCPTYSPAMGVSVVEILRLLLISM